MENLSLFVEIIIVVLLFLIAKKNWKENGKFDERQILERGKAYKYGFFTMFVYYAIYSEFIIDNSIASSMSMVMTGIVLGCLVFSIYSILKDAYSFTKNINTITVVLFLIIGILELLVGIIGIRQNGLIVENSINSAIIDIEYAILFIIDPILIFLKKQFDKEES